MDSKQEILELALLQFFKRSLIKYIDLKKNLQFKKEFIEPGMYSPSEIQQALNRLIEEQYLILHGDLYQISAKGSNKTCENLYKKS